MGLACTTTVQAQYFLRGAVRSNRESALPYAKIILQKSGKEYHAAVDGSFGIYTESQTDSATISLEGYEKQTFFVRADQFQTLTLKICADAASKNKPKLNSFNGDRDRRQRFHPMISDETYFKLIENEFVKADKYPATGFSLNQNKASYSNIRRFINMGSRVPPDAVRTEEMMNYFNPGYKEPAPGETFRITHATGPCPWNGKAELLYLSLSAKKINIDKKPPANFVFLIDVSGSMELPNRLPLLKQAFQLFVNNLRDQDLVTIVTYGGSVGVWLQPTPGSEKATINRAIELLVANGDTPGATALELAYKQTLKTYIPGGNNRVILATDGDFNVGPAGEKALDELISAKRQTGIYLTCLGVGMGNFKDSKLQTLARRGNGNYAYLDDLQEAEKVLVKELSETMYAVADHAYINIEFNPATVNSYRLVGFDNKRDAVLEGDAEIEGGEIGSGAVSTALFEIIREKQDTPAPNSMGSLTLVYHNAADSGPSQHRVTYNMDPGVADTVSSEMRFTAAVAMLGLKLKDSPHMLADWKEVDTYTRASVNRDIFMQGEYLQMYEKLLKVYNVKLQSAKKIKLKSPFGKKQ